MDLPTWPVCSDLSSHAAGLPRSKPSYFSYLRRPAGCVVCAETLPEMPETPRRSPPVRQVFRVFRNFRNRLWAGVAKLAKPQRRQLGQHGRQQLERQQMSAPAARPARRCRPGTASRNAPYFSGLQALKTASGWFSGVCLTDAPSAADRRMWLDPAALLVHQKTSLRSSSRSSAGARCCCRPAGAPALQASCVGR